MESGVEALFNTPSIDVDVRPDGIRVLRSSMPLGPSTPTMAAMLRERADLHPDRPYLVERDAAGHWQAVTYGEMLASAEATGQALLERGLGATRTVMSLSGNSIGHAQVMFGCYLAGVPFTPASVAYSLMNADHSKLRHLVAKVRPALVYVESPSPFRMAVEHAFSEGIEVVSATGENTTPLGDFLATPPGQRIADAERALRPDDVAKFLFTSGSTGMPKGVPTTHRMLCDNQQSIRQVWPFLADQPPILVDWLPWSHTFGGSHNFNLVLNNGGTLYIDAGKPAPGLLEITVKNLRDVSPTIYFNVPAGFAALVGRLEQDVELAAAFFARLQLIFYAAAALPTETWRRLEQVSIATIGRIVPMTSAWGSTETSPLATSAHFALSAAGNIGVPIPGVELKIVPNGNKHEIRVRGSNVMAEYLDEPELTAAAFDDEGFYRIGDAVRFADPDNPAAGVLFDGRIAEDFKLLTGTWVNVTSVRSAIISAASPLVTDAVIAGHDRDFVSALVWIDAAAAAGHLSLTGEPADVFVSQAVQDHLRTSIAASNREAGGSSMQVRRVIVLTSPPMIDANEITDKGYVNQRSVLDNRSHLVERLYSSSDHCDVILINDPQTGPTQ
jgi:feruloyl-CoA synthase